MNPNLNSDLACAVNFEFESKDWRCAKAALREPSVRCAVREALNRKECEQKPLQVHTCSDPSVRVVGKVTVVASLPQMCRTRQNGRSFSVGWMDIKMAFRHFPDQVFSRFRFFTPTGCFSAWHPVPQDWHCFSWRLPDMKIFLA